MPETWGSSSADCTNRGYAVYVYDNDHFKPATPENTHCKPGYTPAPPPSVLPPEVQQSVQDGDLWISCCVPKGGGGGGGSSSSSSGGSTVE